MNDFSDYVCVRVCEWLCMRASERLCVRVCVRVYVCMSAGPRQQRPLLGHPTAEARLQVLHQALRWGRRLQHSDFRG